MADTFNQSIRTITPQGNVTTIAGSDLGYQDGPGIDAKFFYPNGIAVERQGTLYVADSYNNRIRMIAPQGNVTTIAGSDPGYQDGPGVDAKFNYPTGIAVEESSTLYVVDSYNNRIRMITPQGNVTTIAGSDSGYQDGPGVDAKFFYPNGIAFEKAGTLYVADTLNQRIRKITPQGDVTTIAGSDLGYQDGPGADAKFNNPFSIAVDASGTLYVADTVNQRIRRIDAFQINITDTLGSVTLEGDTLYKSINGAPGSTLELGHHDLRFEKNMIDSVFNGTLEGTGGFTIAGNITLGGNSHKYTGEIKIESGTLNVTGELKNTQTIVGSNGILTGTGLVGTVINRGIVTPSDPVGSFTITGDYLPETQGVTKITLNANQANKLSVQGTAYLNNSILYLDVVPEDIKDIKDFEVLSSTHPIVGKFGSIQSSQVRFKWVPDYTRDLHKVYVSIALEPFCSIVNTVTSNPNVLEVAHYMDSLPQPSTSPDLQKIYDTLNTAPNAYWLQDFFSELMPEEVRAASSVSRDTVTLINEINSFRMHSLRNAANSSITSNAFTTNSPIKYRTWRHYLKHTFNKGNDSDHLTQAPSMALNIEQQMKETSLVLGPKGGIWIQGFGNYAKQRTSSTELGYRNKAGGSLIGIDYRLCPDLFIGMNAGYGLNKLTWDDKRTKGNVKDYLISFYSTWFQEQFYMNTSMTASLDRYNLRRRITFGDIDRTTIGHHNGYTLAPSLEVGHGLTFMSDIEVVPFVREDYVYVYEKRYQKKGAGALNLNIGRQISTLLRSEPGVNIYKHFKVEEGLITAKIKLSYVNKHPLKKGKIRANFVGQPGSFLVSGSNKTQHQVSPGLSFNYKSKSGLSISAAYDTQFGSKYKAHEISIKIGHRF